MGEAVLLLSGGMDSGVLLAWASKKYDKIHAINVDYGSKHATKEISMSQNLAKKYGAMYIKIKLPFIAELFSSSLLSSGDPIPEGPYSKELLSSTIVPFRNGIFLSIAVGYAENLHIDKVLIASHAGDHPIYPDCRNTFINAMSLAATEGTNTRVKVEAPFGNMDKRDIARLGRGLGFDFTQTWTCYKGLDLHCGKCSACLERKYALEFDKGLDPTRYLE